MRYWVYLAGEIPGQFDAQGLAALPGFSEAALVCPCEGEPSQRRWQPAGAVSEIARALEGKAPAPMAEPVRGSKAIGPDDILDQTNLRLFRHISQLMKGLEARRGDRSVIESLRENLERTEKALEAAKAELSSAREKQARAAEAEQRCQELESALAKARQETEKLQAGLAQAERERR